MTALRYGEETMGEVRLHASKAPRFAAAARSTGDYDALPGTQYAICRSRNAQRVDPPLTTNRNPVNVGLILRSSSREGGAFSPEDQRRPKRVQRHDA